MSKGRQHVNLYEQGIGDGGRAPERMGQTRAETVDSCAQKFYGKF